MLDYLNRMLGLDAEIAPWPEEGRLPFCLRSGRKYSVLRVGGTECVLVEADEDGFNLPAFRKQMTKLPADPDRVVLCFGHLASGRRRTLIGAGLPFIVPGSQIYMPFLGIVLQERMKAARAAPKKLCASEQLVLLHFIYGTAGSSICKADLAKRLGIGAMDVTRAVRALEALGLVTVEKAGHFDYVSAADAGRELYEKAAAYMTDPVRKRLYVRRKPEFGELPMAGEYALATYGMLAGSSVGCVAVGRKEYKCLDGVEEVDPAWSCGEDYVRMEVWKYDPRTLAAYGRVDTVSLALSLRENGDERVEQAVEEMLERCIR